MIRPSANQVGYGDSETAGSDQPLITFCANAPEVCVIEAGTVFKCSVPYWGQTAHLFVRVLERQFKHLRIRITPDGGRAFDRWVLTSEVDFAITAGILQVLVEQECPSCKGRMRLWVGTRNRKPMTCLACRECTEVIEI